MLPAPPVPFQDLLPSILRHILSVVRPSIPTIPSINWSIHRPHHLPTPFHYGWSCHQAILRKDGERPRSEFNPWRITFQQPYQREQDEGASCKQEQHSAEPRILNALMESASQAIEVFLPHLTKRHWQCLPSRSCQRDPCDHPSWPLEVRIGLVVHHSKPTHTESGCSCCFLSSFEAGNGRIPDELSAAATYFSTPSATYLGTNCYHDWCHCCPQRDLSSLPVFGLVDTLL